MAIDIKFDLVGNPEPPTIILANRNGNKLGQLDIDERSIELSDKLNDASEFTFTIHKKESDSSKSVIDLNDDVLMSSDDYLLADYDDVYLLSKDVDDASLDNSNSISNYSLWNQIVDFKLVYCKEWDKWFEITVEVDESDETVKTVFCTQLGQAELSQIMLYDIEINMEDDIARDDYKITILWNADDNEASLLHRLLKDKAPHYSVVHVDPTIARIQRSFSFDDISIYDAFQEIAEEIGCLFVFDSNSDRNGKIQRTISVYDLQQNCNSCKYRGEFTDVCPECGSTDIKYGYGDDTLIFVTSDELAASGIQLTTDTDAVKNCFKLEAGDDLMTATIRNCNPNGSDYIWRLSDDMKEDMTEELVERIESYDEIFQDWHSKNVIELDTNLLTEYNALVDKYDDYNKELQQITNPIKGYSPLMNAYYNTIDLELYLKSALMPSIETSKTTASDQAELLTTSLFLSTVAVANIDTVSLPTVDSTVLAFAKTIVKPTYKVQIKDSGLTDNKGSWIGNFVITNYSDEEDTAISASVSVFISGDVEKFVQQKLEKALNKENTDDFSIIGLFKKEILLEVVEDNDKNYKTVHSVDENGNCKCPFCAELKKYALNPLISFREACQACIDILIEQDIGNDTTSDLYKNLYDPYYKKLMAIEDEIALREKEINVISGVYDFDGNLVTGGLQQNIEKHRDEIQNILDFEKYLGEELWLEFCSYRREDKYSNDNYISDGLDNAELFKRALEFFDVAENEIYKASELQHSISTTLNNLLAIPKFKPLVNSFKVGNWIRIQVDDRIYKLRLLEYSIDYGDFDNISVEFSDVTRIKNGTTDVQDILSKASSMATSYDSVQRQANKGNDAKGTISQWVEEGLNTANIQIKSNDNEDIQLTKNGLLCRTFDDVTGTWSPKQLKLTHNIMAYTNDDWSTVKQAIGEHDYKYYDNNGNLVNETGYGMTAEFVNAGYISGSQIIGGDIYSDNYSITNRTGSYLNLRDGTFNFGGGALRFENNKLTISSPDIPTTETITQINEEYLKTTSVYAEKLVVNAAKVNGELSAATIAAESITGTTLTGKTISGGKLLIGNKTSDSYAEITFDGVLNCRGANISGTIYADSGEIGGCSIVGGSLQIGAANISGLTSIVNGIVTTDYVEALGISVDAANVSGTLSADIVSIGGSLRVVGGGYIGYVSGSNRYGNTDGIGMIDGTDSNMVVATDGGAKLASYTSEVICANSITLKSTNSIYAGDSLIGSSDRRLKEDIRYDVDDYLSLFDALKPATFSWIEKTNKARHLGMIAQDVETAMIDVGIAKEDFAPLDINENGMYGLAYSEFVPLLIAKVQKLDAELKELKQNN